MTAHVVSVRPLAPDALASLLQRLSACAATLGLNAEARADQETSIAVSRMFGALVSHVHTSADEADLWLLMTALGGALPTADDVQDAARQRELTTSADLSTYLLEQAHSQATTVGSPECEMDVVSNGVVVDVDFSSRNDLHTGIQRVVRETVPRWYPLHELTLTAWTAAGGSLRHLDETERDRVLRWDSRPAGAPSGSTPPRTGPPSLERLVVPWRSSVILLENPSPDSCPALVGIARYSGNTVSLIGYDCIPLLSPDLIHAGLADRFMRFLEVVKHADTVAGISAGATVEFEGFASMTSAQGLAGPRVAEVSLPVEVPAGVLSSRRRDVPLVVSVGSFEPRKNQLAVLHAAERLWREGHEFELQFIGGGGWVTEFDSVMRRLVSSGRPIVRRTAISDTELWNTIRAARFTVFVSLHEGFGLPVAESLACGVPCLTSGYGSTREIADGGGALVVDPRDDDDVVRQFRRLLVDDDLITELRRQAADRPPRTWDDYARDLWDEFIDHADAGA